MRSGKIGLNDYLYSVGIRDSPLCDLCDSEERQTISHILLSCEGLDGPRERFSTPLSRTAVCHQTADCPGDSHFTPSGVESHLLLDGTPVSQGG